jgi:hypothetical protein
MVIAETANALVPVGIFIALTPKTRRLFIADEISELRFLMPVVS